MTTPQELKQIISEGLLSFPVTDFDAEGNFRPSTYVERLEWLAPYGASALFVAGGTGEFFSLTRDDYSNVVRTAAETCKGKVPILAGAGGPTRVAIEYAREAQRLGANGVLLMPHYLTEASQEGIAEHAEQVCKAVPDIGVIIYNRANSKLNADMLERLGDRFAYLGGLPTAEVYAAAYKALGVPVYSSAVFNFIPKTAMDFYRAIAADDHATVGKLIDEFFLPYLKIRNRRAGYAVSIVKAGAKLVGHDAGPVRAPLTDLSEAELAELDVLIKKLGAQ
ncbi:5-dehydro-4-deoxyglucarate dehydratase [Burkholderia gladioli]|uniref:5-dehydro-4-deoxyglucarate dehydratase n=1 Tax=Burkholderia gladioli TaxID=28095 RepID=UPI001640E6CE|nr:5-dehydro-4-deoxyglucarate dehydratase [Burkholderia gladioli]